MTLAAKMTPADWIGILGFIIAVGNLTWSFWTHHDQVKEKLIGHAHAQRDDRGAWLIATVINTGRVPVFIARVTLEGACSGVSCPMFPYGDFPEDPFNFNVMASKPLAAGEGRAYALPVFSDINVFEGMGDIQNARQYQYWISVHTTRGEALRINDKVFLGHLKSFVSGKMSKLLPKWESI